MSSLCMPTRAGDGQRWAAFDSLGWFPNVHNSSLTINTFINTKYAIHDPLQ